MTTIPRIRKVRPGHLIAKILLTNIPEVAEGQPREGRWVPYAELLSFCASHEAFIENDKRPNQGYKLGGYINDIKKYDFGDVRVMKNGREVEAVQLRNVDEFNAETGQNDTKFPPPTPEQLAEKEAAKTTKKAPKEKVAKTVPPFSVAEGDGNTVQEFVEVVDPTVPDLVDIAA